MARKSVPKAQPRRPRGFDHPDRRHVAVDQEWQQFGADRSELIPVHWAVPGRGGLRWGRGVERNIQRLQFGAEVLPREGVNLGPGRASRRACSRFWATGWSR